jgi:menaquinone-dependent protoporphyrinogen oxidase
MHVFYASRDGQARRIAERIALRLQERGIAAAPCDLAASPPAASALAECPIVILIAAVRYGRHLSLSRR